jgi:hypothetical protein
MLSTDPTKNAEGDCSETSSEDTDETDEDEDATDYDDGAERKGDDRGGGESSSGSEDDECPATGGSSEPALSAKGGLIGHAMEPSSDAGQGSDQNPSGRDGGGGDGGSRNEAFSLVTSDCPGAGDGIAGLRIHTSESATVSSQLDLALPDWTDDDMCWQERHYSMPVAAAEEEEEEQGNSFKMPLLSSVSFPEETRSRNVVRNVA